MKDRQFGRAAPDVNSRIANRVRALRAELDLSLVALAERCGVSRSMLSLIERGESSPTAVVLDRIATGLGVPMDMRQAAKWHFRARRGGVSDLWLDGLIETMPAADREAADKAAADPAAD